MKYYYFQYLDENLEEITIKTDSKEKREIIAKFIQSNFKHRNSEGYFWEEEKDEGSLEKER